MPVSKKVTNIRESADMRTIVARIEERTAMLVDRFDTVDERISKLVDAMSHLPVLTERQTSIKESLDTHVEDEMKTMKETDGRLQKIESALPSLMETRKWIVTGVLGILSLVGVAAWEMIVPQKRFIVNTLSSPVQTQDITPHTITVLPPTPPAREAAPTGTK